VAIRKNRIKLKCFLERYTKRKSIKIKASVIAWNEGGYLENGKTGSTKLSTIIQRVKYQLHVQNVFFNGVKISLLINSLYGHVKG
jgi:hypothetical protein